MNINSTVSSVAAQYPTAGAAVAKQLEMATLLSGASDSSAPFSQLLTDIAQAPVTTQNMLAQYKSNLGNNLDTTG